MKLFPEESKKKISEAAKGNKYCLGQKQSEYTINKRVSKLIGKKHPSGYKLTDEHKEIIRKTHTGKKASPETLLKRIGNKWNPNNIEICQYDLDGNMLQEFHSIKEASRVTKMSSGSIREILRGVTLKPKRFTFKYK